MKKALTSLLLMILTTTFSPTLKAQNLVPNPSFEIFDTCPNNPDQVKRAQGWSSFGNSPDYFNSCNVSNIVSVPENALGYQFAATGDAYCGLYTYSTPSLTYREYIGSKLTDSLLINHKYFVSFKVSLADISIYSCWSDKVGIRFSTIAYTASLVPPLNNFAHIFSQSVISDTMNWTKVSDSFTADSNYKYLIIGNFFDNLHTDTLNCGGGSWTSYLYLDDVCVSTDSLTCNSGGEGIKKIFNANYVIVYPNPTEKTFFIQTDLSSNIKEIVIYNALGELVKFALKKVDDKKYIVDLIDSDKGIYFIKLFYRNQTCLNKIVIIN